jgi:monoamine oxidase
MIANYDVTVVGAGAAGLIAANELALAGMKTVVIEARDRPGGRIFSYYSQGLDDPLEMGAEFVHGNLELTKHLLKKAGIEISKVKGEIWEKKDGKLKELKDFIADYPGLKKKFKDLKKDMSVDEFIKVHLREDGMKDLRFTLKNYVEGYYAADTKRASVFALKEELTISDDVQYRIDGGYGKLVHYLFEECFNKGVEFVLESPVKKIKWRKNHVEVYTKEHIFRAEKVLLTLPMGVLRSEQISFVPAIPEKIELAKSLGYGPVIKVLLVFKEAFWKDEKLMPENFSKFGFVFSEEKVPTWWTQYPRGNAVLTGWCGGPHAEELKNLSREEMLNETLNSLAKIFSLDVMFLRGLLDIVHIADWINDPYCMGAYSYDVVNGKELKEEFKKPVEDTIYFAGEGLHDGPEIGTVEGALISGRDVAQQLIVEYQVSVSAS